MPDVKITASVEDRTKGGWSAVENGAKSAFTGIKEGAASAFTRVEAVVESAVIKASSTFDKLKENWLAVTGAITGAWLTVQKAIDYARMGAAAEQSEESYRRVTVAYGEDAEQLAAKMKQASAGLIDDSELMQRAVRGLQQHLSGNELVQLLELSRGAARNAGEDVKSAFDGITTSIENQTVRGLKHYGIVIDQNKAYEDYAGKIGLAKDALSEQQQTQALLNAVLEEGGRQMKAMGDITANASEKFQKSAVQVEELKETLGKGLLGVLGAFDAALHTVASSILFTASAFATLIGYSPALYFTEAGEAARQAGKDLWGAAQEMGEKALGKWSAAWDQLTVAAQGGEKANTKAAAGAKGAAKAAADAATAQENLKKRIEETTAILPGYSQAFQQVTASKDRFAGDVFSKALADEAEHLDHNKAALDTYRAGLGNVGTLMQLYSGSMDTTVVRMDSYRSSQEAINNLSSVYGLDVLPMLVKGGDTYARTMAAMTANLSVLETAFGRYMGDLNDVEAEQLRYQTSIKSVLESIQEQAAKISPTLGAQVARAIAAQQVEILKVEQASATTRLAAYQKYYDELKKLHASTVQQMLDKTKEMAEAERIYLDARKSTADIQFDIQKQFMTAAETYYATEERNRQKFAQAMGMPYKESMQALQDLKQAAIANVTEIKDGDTVLISRQDTLAAAWQNLQAITDAETRKYREFQQAGTQALATLDANAQEIESRMKSALDNIDSIRTAVVELDLEIATQRVFTIDTSKAVADVKSLIGLIQSVPGATSGGSASPAPSGVPDYYSEGTWGGPGAPEPEVLDSLAKGTNYVPRTGLYMLHKGGGSGDRGAKPERRTSGIAAGRHASHLRKYNYQRGQQEH